jgi:hypothetical protein
MNRSNGWICIGDPNFNEGISVEFVPHCISVLKRDKQLKSLWLQPKIIKSKEYT